jgi:hypothetical protein
MFHDEPLTFFYGTAVRIVEHVANLCYFATDFLLKDFDSLKVTLLSCLIADSSQPSLNRTDVASQHPISLWHKEPLCNWIIAAVARGVEGLNYYCRRTIRSEGN